MPHPSRCTFEVFIGCLTDLMPYARSDSAMTDFAEILQPLATASLHLINRCPGRDLYPASPPHVTAQPSRQFGVLADALSAVDLLQA